MLRRLLRLVVPGVKPWRGRVLLCERVHTFI